MKARQKITDLTCEELVNTIGQEVKYHGLTTIIRAIYFYVNTNGISSIRVRLSNSWQFVVVDEVYKQDDTIIYKLR